MRPRSNREAAAIPNAASPEAERLKRQANSREAPSRAALGRAEPASLGARNMRPEAGRRRTSQKATPELSPPPPAPQRYPNRKPERRFPRKRSWNCEARNSKPAKELPNPKFQGEPHHAFQAHTARAQTALETNKTFKASHRPSTFQNPERRACQRISRKLCLLQAAKAGRPLRVPAFTHPKCQSLT